MAVLLSVSTGGVTEETRAATTTAKDGTKIYYKDWGKGPVVTVSHGWPVSADAWDGQMLFLAQHFHQRDK